MLEAVGSADLDRLLPTDVQKKKKKTTSECIWVPKKVDLLKQKNNLLKFVYVIYI